MSYIIAEEIFQCIKRWYRWLFQSFYEKYTKKYINQCHCIAGSGDVKIAITCLLKD